MNPTWPGCSKIGVARNLTRRLGQFNCADPTRSFDMRGWEHFDDAYAAERAIHQQLKTFRLEGEWFGLHPDLAFQAIQEYARTNNVD